MSKPFPPGKVNHFLGILYNKEYFSWADLEIRLKEFWPNRIVTHLSSEFQFSLANYYESEMGNADNLVRRWLFWDELENREDLVTLKHEANLLEEKLKFVHGLSGRPVNLDPGFISLEQMVLATGKPYSHRLFLGREQSDFVYGELTYIFKDKKWCSLPWTYPDYREDCVKEVFLKRRGILAKSSK